VDLSGFQYVCVLTTTNEICHPEDYVAVRPAEILTASHLVVHKIS